MHNYKVDLAKLDEIIKRTIDAIDVSKNEIYDIAESARRECKRLEEELQYIKNQIGELVNTVDNLEKELKESKKKLAHVNKYFDRYSQEELKEAYEKADNLRIELAVKREQEQHLIKRRNDLEVRLKEATKIVEKAENLISHIGVALEYLSGNLKEMSIQIEDIRQRQLFGLRIIKAQEEERQRVARDIHDGPAQSMSNVVIKAEICERLIDIDVDRAREELKNLKKIVRYSLQDIRKIIYKLRPMSLDDLGLLPTLQKFLLTFQEESGINTSFKAKGTCCNIKSEISLTIFRIVQEAISNVKKHANAKNVVVNLEFLENQIRLYIYDDGQGFRIEDLKKSEKDINKGFGLYSMKERVELLSGEFLINSEPGKGTRLDITIPLSKEEGGIDDKGSDS